MSHRHFPLPQKKPLIYRIARNFRGLKFSRFSRISFKPRQFYPRNFCQLRHVVNTSLSQIAHPRKFSGRPIHENFSPRKFLAIRYMKPDYYYYYYYYYKLERHQLQLVAATVDRSQMVMFACIDLEANVNLINDFSRPKLISNVCHY